VKDRTIREVSASSTVSQQMAALSSNAAPENDGTVPQLLAHAVLPAIAAPPEAMSDLRQLALAGQALNPEFPISENVFEQIVKKGEVTKVVASFEKQHDRILPEGQERFVVRYPTRCKGLCSQCVPQSILKMQRILLAGLSGACNFGMIVKGQVVVACQVARDAKHALPKHENKKGLLIVGCSRGLFRFPDLPKANGRERSHFW